MVRKVDELESEYFPISHPYFYDYMLKKNISSDKYIKLFNKSSITNIFIIYINNLIYFKKKL